MKQRIQALVMGLAVTVVLATGAQLAQAQAGAGAGAGMGAGGSADKPAAMAKLEQMSTALQLTPQQKQQMMPIMIEDAQKMKAIKTNTSLGPMQKMSQMRQVGDEMDAKVKPILSPDQYQKFEQIRQQERQQMMEKMRSGQGM
jgi:predicted transglutaminase-like cysteine proteinase